MRSGTNFSATNTVAIGSGLAFDTGGGIQGGVYENGKPIREFVPSYNTFIGYQSGSDVRRPGADNILIGPEANTGGTHLKTGSNDILMAASANTPATTASNLLNIGLFGTLPATTSATSFSVSTAGMIGIGGYSLLSRLSVWGANLPQDSNSSASNIVSSASTTVFSVFDGGNAKLSGSLSQSSDSASKPTSNHSMPRRHSRHQRTQPRHLQLD